MDWKQIENKWAAMTHRVRADWVSDRADRTSLPLRRGAKPDATPVIPADRSTGMVGKTRVKLSIE